MNKYTIELSEKQLLLIAQCVEDLHRFMSGQMELNNTLTRLPWDLTYETQQRLKELKTLITPGLPYNASYSWSGVSCPNKHQRKFIAQTYAIYREIYHQLAIDNNRDNVYTSQTLTCEDGGELPIIKKL